MDTLYHYCGNESFLSIVTNKEIWLSSLSMSNDRLEGKLVSRTIGQIASKSGMDANDLARLDKTIKFLEETVDALGFCLSEESDLLSQWRAYADDGYGVSIGFSEEYLRGLSARGDDANPSILLRKIKYENDDHEEELRPAFNDIQLELAGGAFRSLGRRTLMDSRTPEEIEAENSTIVEAEKKLFLRILGIFPTLFALKMNAFREEKEWRLLVPRVRGEKVTHSFRARRSMLVPFKKVGIAPSTGNAIKEVILGPKNGTPIHLVKGLLSANGFEDVEVSTSSASYR